MARGLRDEQCASGLHRIPGRWRRSSGALPPDRLQCVLAPTCPPSSHCLDGFDIGSPATQARELGRREARGQFEPASELTVCGVWGGGWRHAEFHSGLPQRRVYQSRYAWGRTCYSSPLLSSEQYYQPRFAVTTVDDEYSKPHGGP